MALPDRTEVQWPEWDSLGEDEVARRWAAGRYATDDKPAYDEWLRRKREAKAEVEKQKDEVWRANELSCTVSAKNAAWVAAGAAIIGLVISLILLARSCSDEPKEGTQQEVRPVSSESAQSASPDEPST